MDSDSSAELLVIGSGPGGYVAAIRAGQLGIDTMLVEKDAYGGTCLNHGCIPSKALISASDIAYRAGESAELGIDAEISVDLARMVAWKAGIVDRLTTGVERLSKANGVTLKEGAATFLDGQTAEISGPEGTETVSFDHAIVATGSHPIEIPGFDFADEPVLNSRQALSLDSRPDSLVVVGGGYIGMELAGVFAKLGTDVTVVEMLDSILPAYEDEELVRPVAKRANNLGIEFHFGEAAQSWEHTGNGITVTTENEAGEPSTYEADKVLVAVGRQPVADTIGIEHVDVTTDDRGFIESDAQGRTNSSSIFAVGDVAGEPMLAHAASAEGLVAAETIAGNDASIEDHVIPAAVFTDPEIGMVGVSPTEAEQLDAETITGKFPFYASGRALTTGRSDGFVRIIAEQNTGIVIGGQVVGSEASELVAELGLAIENELTVEEIGHTVHAHPTLSEGVMEAADNALDRAIHTLNR